MKREIKFRAWHKETKQMLNIWPYEWIKGHYAGTGKPNESFNNEFEITPDGNNCNRVTGKSVFMTLDGQIIGVVPVDEKTTQSVNYSEEYELMQFTGLKDKNGKEIYEGDIVKISTGSVHDKQLFTIGFRMGSFEMQANDDLPPLSFIYMAVQLRKAGKITKDYQTMDFIEVIGNIYENPELL